MRYFVFLILLVICSCDKDENLDPMTGGIDEVSCGEQDCKILNPYSFNAWPSENSIELTYSQTFIVDGFGKTCVPDALDFYISEDELSYEKVARVAVESGTYVIENLDEGNTYFIKMVNLHCELDSAVSPIVSVTVQNIPLPTFIENPLAFERYEFEDFRIAPNGDQFMYRNNYNDWYLSSFSNPKKGNRIFDSAFFGSWNPYNQSELSFVSQASIVTEAGIPGSVSDKLSSLDLNTRVETVRHQISNLWSFSSDHIPEEYSIHEFFYGLDERSIYFSSNKDNGSTTRYEKSVFENLWKLDLESNDIEPLSDFLAVQFDLDDFVEDPKRPGNFYLLGGMDKETVETVGGLFALERIDVHYYDTQAQTLTAVFETDIEEKYLSIDPKGENLLFSSDLSGSLELWCYNIASQELKQISNSRVYIPRFDWKHLSWVSDNEFMTYVYYKPDKTYKFARFKI